MTAATGSVIRTYRGNTRPANTTILADLPLLSEDMLAKVHSEPAGTQHLGLWVLVTAGAHRNRIVQMSYGTTGRTVGDGGEVLTCALLNPAIDSLGAFAIPLSITRGRQALHQVVKARQSYHSSTMMDYEIGESDPGAQGLTRGTADWWVLAKSPADPGVNPTAPVVEDAPTEEEVDWEARWHALWAALDAEARHQDWCEQYDRFAQQNGGPVRKNEYLATVRLSQDVNTRDLSRALSSTLNANGESIDVVDDLTVQYEVNVTIVCTAASIADEDEDFNSDMGDLLRERGYVFEEFDLMSYDQA